jgi:phenylacetyl-CoA:acceptor oxidoreductase subunit 1
MTRYIMVADLRRCVGCQTCTAACKEANGTPPGVQWRRVLDIEAGEYPEVSRVFVPSGCQHCDQPPCMEVCPSGATGKRADGLVTIDYDVCIGCAACIMACPYEARYKVDEAEFAFGHRAIAAETKRFDPRHVGVATKCTFCLDRIDAGLAKNLVPGIDPEATPVCTQGCISGALRFGDLDDPNSEVSRLLAEHQWFRMHETEGTGPGFYYLWDKGAPL